MRTAKFQMNLLIRPVRLGSSLSAESTDTTGCFNGEQKSGSGFVHVQDDLNPHILRMLEGTFSIKKTYLYNFDPLKPHFYIVRLGFTGVYIIFLISAQKHRLWYWLEPPRQGGSN